MHEGTRLNFTSAVPPPATQLTQAELEPGFEPMSPGANFSYEDGTWESDANATLINDWGAAHEQV